MTENASGLPEGQALPADTEQHPATGAETQEQQQEERRFTQEDLDKAIQRRVAKAERKAQAELQAVRQELESLKANPKPADNQSTSSKEPQRGEFQSYEDYVEAKALWKTEQTLEKRLNAEREARENDSKKAKQEESSKALQKRVQEVIEKGNDKYPDFDAVVNDAVEDGLIPVGSAMYHALIESDASHELIYHLAKNEAEAKRIAGLSPVRQAAEIGKLEDRLAAKTKTREVIDPVTSRGSTQSGPRDDMSMDAWMKARAKQLKERA